MPGPLDDDQVGGGPDEGRDLPVPLRRAEGVVPDWVTATGHHVGTFERPLFDLPQTDGAALAARRRGAL